ncbi:hypothetical protein FUA23_11365 [Neolewinella aurantiaca]|uniref:Uncharacterized protein n=1 Tax=Neolewinella aurantiaca TaxID=2602767 RepID=A0A5C7FG86_9BACT|nr:hypothetical protein [Neolewinella aurantiaca]TXF89336.1 hypothetical protein FUA23_11365 [Neolewinella aurantiaca]
MFKLLTLLPCLFPLCVFGQLISWWPTSHPTEYPVSKLLVVNDLILSSTLGGEVFSSADGGDHWEAVTESPQHFAIRDMIYVEDQGLIVATSHHGVFVSQDFGRSWEESNENLGCLNTNNLTTDESYLYASTSNGLYQRELAGRSWEKMELPKRGYSSFIHTVQATPIGIFAGGVSALYYSADQGASWSKYQSSEFTDVISLSWFENKLLVGTSGRGIFNLESPEGEWLEEVDLESAREARVIDQLLAVNGSVVILSGDIGLGIGNEILSTGLPDKFLMDFLRLEQNDLVATRFRGVYTSKRPILGLQNTAGQEVKKNPLDAIRIYPTVTADEITIEIPSAETAKGVNNIRLLNSAGSVVKEIALGEFSPRRTVSLRDLPAGNYWCQLILDQEVFQQLIILSK